MDRKKNFSAAALLLFLAGCTMFPDPNQAAVAERRSLSKQISALQTQKDLTEDERVTLAKLSSVVSSGQRFNGNQVAAELTNIEQALDSRRVIAAGTQLEKSRRDKYLVTHPKTTQPVRESITNGKVIIGMTADEVVASWGEPLQRARAAGATRSSEQWFYGGNIYLYMENRKVASFHGSR